MNRRIGERIMQRPTILMALFLTGMVSATPALAGDPEAGKEKMQACMACHGEQGVGDAEQYPILAGQHEDYLYHALKSYKEGDRNNAIMSGQVSSLSDQDMRDLAAYYAAQDPEGSVFTTRIDRSAGID